MSILQEICFCTSELYMLSSLRSLQYKYIKIRLKIFPPIRCNVLLCEPVCKKSTTYTHFYKKHAFVHLDVIC